MLCGCPVILSDQVRGRFDLVRPGVTGDIYPVGDTDALASSLQKMLSRPSQLASLSRHARERVNTCSPRESVAGIVEAIGVAILRRHGGNASPRNTVT